MVGRRFQSPYKLVQRFNFLTIPGEGIFRKKIAPFVELDLKTRNQ